MELAKQGSKPTGLIGYFIGKLMNVFHTRFYRKYYSKVLPQASLNYLDIGCGGGRLIKYLNKENKGYKLFGLDHSHEMVSLSKKVNFEAIKNGDTEINCGSVSNLPYNNNSMNIITANETVQFWQDISKSFSEVYRVLIKGGMFYITNRFPAENTKWWKMAQLKNEDDFKNALKNAGFQNIDIDLTIKKGWIIIKVLK